VNDRAVSFGNSAEAIEAGVGMVSQHYGIIPGLTCLQNLILGSEGGAVLSMKQMRDRAETLADRMGFRFDWSADADSLTPAGAQKLEILKLLWRDSKIMILDEPTAMLSPSDAVALFASLRQVVAHGATVLLVTHRLPEVMDYCQTVTVLRGGKRVAELAVHDTTELELTRLIVGDPSFEMNREALKSRSRSSAARLALTGVTVLDERRHEALKEASLAVFEGEVVGIAGVDGNGQRELFRAITGLVKPQTGEQTLDGEQLGSGVDERLRRGVRWIPEDRHREAIVSHWNLFWNSVLGRQRTPVFAPGARGPWAERVAAKFQTRHGGLGQPMSSLSGGNQQRFVVARELESDPRLLLAFQPARGLDLKGTRDVYAAIRERCQAGMAALIISFDLDELITHCDRIFVLNGGRLQEAGSKDRDEIGRLMVGGSH
jgi:simple sugar transport system ATP-binding protein